jgi:hypothetical protein
MGIYGCLIENVNWMNPKTTSTPTPDISKKLHALHKRPSSCLRRMWHATRWSQRELRPVFTGHCLCAWTPLQNKVRTPWKEFADRQRVLPKRPQLVLKAAIHPVHEENKNSETLTWLSENANFREMIDPSDWSATKENTSNEQVPHYHASRHSPSSRKNSGTMNYAANNIQWDKKRIRIGIRIEIQNVPQIRFPKTSRNKNFGVDANFTRMIQFDQILNQLSLPK